MVKPKHSTQNKLNIEFVPDAWEDFLYWQKQDKATFKKLLALIKECQRSPFEGTGKPERLKHFQDNIWSRRITIEHRLVYAVDEGRLTIIQARYHYSK